MTRLRAVLALATGVLSACGGGGDGSTQMPMPDAPVGGDTTPPAIVSTTPTEGALHVSVLEPITVIVDEVLDEATVTGATVSLGVTTDAWQPFYSTGTSDMVLTDGPGGSPVYALAGSVTYDGAYRTITFTPAAPLTWGRSYTLTLSGLKDLAGNALPDSSLHFVTSFNGAKRQQSWSSIGQPTGYIEYSLDGTGLLTKQLDYTGPGIDTSWYTNDDYIGQGLDLTFLADGRVSRAFKIQAGNDGKLNTSDDFHLEGHQYNYDASGRFSERLYAAPGGEGTDTVFGTSDDVISNLFRYQYDGIKLAGYVSYYGAGTDTAWRTADDWCDLYWTYTYDASLRRTRETKTSCGNDKIQSGDDLISYYHDNTYDPATGALVMRTQRSVGVDNIPYNGDDDYQTIEKWQVDSAGRVTAYFRYNGPGTDATWNTSDDVVQTHTRTTYGTNGLVAEVTSYSGRGNDNTWGTSDDVISSYSRFFYDASGARIAKTTYGAGPDTMFKTSDDVTVQNVEYDTTH